MPPLCFYLALVVVFHRIEFFFVILYWTEFNNSGYIYGTCWIFSFLIRRLPFIVFFSCVFFVFPYHGKLDRFFLPTEQLYNQSDFAHGTTLNKSHLATIHLMILGILRNSNNTYLVFNFLWRHDLKINFLLLTIEKVMYQRTDFQPFAF